MSDLPAPRPPATLARLAPRAGHVGAAARGLALMKHKWAVPVAVAVVFAFNGVAPVLWIWLMLAWTRRHEAQAGSAASTWALRVLSLPVAVLFWLPVSILPMLAAGEGVALVLAAALGAAGAQLSVAVFFRALRARAAGMLPGHRATTLMRRVERLHALRLLTTAVTFGIVAVGALSVQGSGFIGGLEAVEGLVSADAAMVLVLVGEGGLSLLAAVALLRSSAAAARAPVWSPGDPWPDRLRGWATALSGRHRVALGEAQGGLEGAAPDRRVRVTVDLAAHPSPARVLVRLEEADRAPDLRLEARGDGPPGVPLSDPILSRLVRLTGVPEGAGAALLADLHAPVLAVVQAFPGSTVREGWVCVRATVQPASAEGPELDGLVDAAVALADALDGRLRDWER